MNTSKKKLQYILTVIWITFKQINLTINAKNVMSIISFYRDWTQTKPNKAWPKVATFVWISVYILLVLFSLSYYFVLFWNKNMKSNQRSVQK